MQTIITSADRDCLFHHTLMYFQEYALFFKITSIPFNVFICTFATKLKSMNKVIYLFAAAAIFSSCQQSLEDRCAQEAERYTKKNCPTRINEITVIDSLIFERDTHTLHYYYTLTGYADNPEIVSKINAGNVLLDQIKNSTSIKMYKDAGYNFAYTYYSQKNKGTVLFEQIFTEKDYKTQLSD